MLLQDVVNEEMANTWQILFINLQVTGLGPNVVCGSLLCCKTTDSFNIRLKHFLFAIVGKVTAAALRVG